MGENRRNTCCKKDFCNKCPALEESEWVIEYQKHFNNDPDEGYEEWTSEIVHCKIAEKDPVQISVQIIALIVVRK